MAFGEPVKVTDANGKITTGTYDQFGRLSSVTEPGNSSGTPDAAYTYSITNTAPSYIETKVLGPNGNQIASYEMFDGLLNPRQTQHTAPDGKRTVTDTQYDGRGLPVKESVVYNAGSGPTAGLFGIVDTDVKTQTRITYDAAERETTERLWSGNVAQPQLTTTSYLGADLVKVTPPAGGTVTETVTDVRGRTTELRQYKTATTYNSTKYGFNDVGELMTLTDPAGKQWVYEYDLLGREKKSTDPDAGESLTTYYPDGEIETVKDARGQVLWFKYDQLGRKTQTRDGHSGGVILSEWTYDDIQIGLPTSSTRHDGASVYKTAVSSYDAGYRPQSVTYTIPGFGGSGASLSYTVSNTYKTNGALASRTLPAAGGLAAETFTYGYAASGVPLTLTGAQTYIHSTLYTYDARVLQQVLGNPGKQIRVTTTPDLATRRTKVIETETETSLGTFAQKHLSDYGYDAAGNITSAGTIINGTRDQIECFSYDLLQRVKEAWTQSAGGSGCTPQKTGADPYWRTWTYDDIGNRLTQAEKNTDGSTNTNWNYTVGATGFKPHQLSKVDATGPLAGTPSRSFTYSPAGSMATRTTETGATQNLDWDQENHLKTVTQGNVTVGSYRYWPHGARMLATERQPDGTGEKTTLYLPDGTELTKTGTTITGQRYIGGVAVRDGNGVKLWIVNNHQGTAVAQIDDTTLAVTPRRTMPFGETRGTQPANWFGTKGYVGGTKDAPTGLTHLGAREYDPTIGRFTSNDPIMDRADPQQWNPYSYSSNNPVTLSDPDGLRADIEPGGRGGGRWSNCYTNSCYEQVPGGRGRPSKDQLHRWAAGEGSQARPNRDINPNARYNRPPPDVAKPTPRSPRQAQNDLKKQQRAEGWTGSGTRAARKGQPRTAKADAKTKSGTEASKGDPGKKPRGKPGPKTNGEGPHNEAIKKTAEKVVDGKVVAGGGGKKEILIKTPGGKKEGRRPDILVQKHDGSGRYGINVGKQGRHGAPVKRETDAIEDLEDVGIPMYFVPYN
ncbi:MAG TPA: hypothetical protein DGG94_06940 [Micromonosporaceae bacterium]|nr:hypothetical protein [Micromonosporaceae bacterium]HCU49523.1 hypothetical protein [Micromonosporaceae bacterium]